VAAGIETGGGTGGGARAEAEAKAKARVRKREETTGCAPVTKGAVRVTQAGFSGTLVTHCD